ncbi:MAG: carboxypeptidase regulatory-like domain-containing protein [Bryobacteraceae bacterium]|nr:carboxypeptidase regulatory-like domain-containing protein [Bryobacteraceae bacterium]
MLPLLIACAPWSLAGPGVIQGIVLEHASGRAMARIAVTLLPVAEADGKVVSAPVSSRTGRSGQFTFSRVPPGLYVIIATHPGYFPASWGQRIPAGRGRPIAVGGDSSFFAEIRMRHRGAITGRVLDENGVGESGVPVVAYHGRLPLRFAGSTRSEEWGRYRIPGLLPGKYWVRSGGHVLLDGSGWLPTFSPGGQFPHNARLIEVSLDTDTGYADVSPEAGRTFGLNGRVSCAFNGAVLVTLSSETGQRFFQTSCGEGFAFSALAPGPHELFAATQTAGASAFLELNLSGDLPGVNLTLVPLPRVVVEVEVGGTKVAATQVPVKLVGRRLNIAEIDPLREIPLGQTALPPGHWEFRAEAPPGYYVADVAAPSQGSQRRKAAEQLNEWYPSWISQTGDSHVSVRLSDKPAILEGQVTENGKPVPGVTVFLWPETLEGRRAAGGFLQMLSDTKGGFYFANLPPGNYRVVASFDILELDADLIEVSKAVKVTAKHESSNPLELRPWTAPF